MDFSTINLRGSTIFNLTTDAKIIKGEFGIDVSQEEYSKNISIEKRISDFLDYADLIDDPKLRDAIHIQFKKELSLFGFE